MSKLEFYKSENENLRKHIKDLRASLAINKELLM